MSAKAHAGDAEGSNTSMLDIDLASDGRHFGWMHIPHSTDASAFGRIEIPIVSMRNGQGPTILCMGGVHGDEYVGQIVWNRLIRLLDPEGVRGQLIILPAANVPAAVAGTRVSPIDALNLNRIFPGDPKGSPTMRIAHFIEHELIARADFLIDLHGGASSSLYLSGPTVSWADDLQEMERRLQLLRIFGAPRGYIFEESRGGVGGTLGACRRHGVERLGTEIGGGGIVSPADIRMMYCGVLRVLVHLKAIDPAYLAGLPEPEAPRIFRRGRATDGGFIYAPESGLFEPLVELGEFVEAGRHVGDIHMPETPTAPVVRVHASRSGTVMCRQRPARMRQGDCLMILADEFPAGRR